MSLTKAHSQTVAATTVPSGISAMAVSEISISLNLLLADMFALFFKAKNFHWHMTGPHFRDYHLLLDEQSAQIFAATDLIAERVRKLGGTTLRSMAHAVRLQRTADNDSEYVAPRDMLVELLEDNQQLAVQLRDAHALCDTHGDVASASLIENWIDEAEGRAWFLAETIA
ncbi:DNA starvation/stationary phase protection protein [Dyella dinghuensis]|uniref:DNA starvation/stationary phase protection protein n=1 Tax=Dyella dinghuensis TaxID=1920169 RepID=A0A432LV62_9GAMM|nr:DNA starvation/stationary phase protection protein [Dyella dinghuensis]RUL64530.1 DNA starvation/stationary phase protection protein [Dyella dinghuensis]